MSIQNTNLPNNPNIEVIKAKETGLFTNYIFKAIPLAFDESMSYYETLCGLLSYLKDTVIPTVNNNADAVSELQNLYVELKTYVDDYFKNLDVQNEINNKLDQMTKDGTLTELIKKYIDPLINEQNNTINNLNKKIENATSGSPAGVYATVNDLINANPDHSRIYLVTEDGKWYYYNENWLAGGIYQSTGILDNSISEQMTTYYKLNVNKFLVNNINAKGYNVTYDYDSGITSISGTVSETGGIEVSRFTVVESTTFKYIRQLLSSVNTYINIYNVNDLSTVVKRFSSNVLDDSVTLEPSTYAIFIQANMNTNLNEQSRFYLIPNDIYASQNIISTKNKLYDINFYNNHEKNLNKDIYPFENLLVAQLLNPTSMYVGKLDLINKQITIDAGTRFIYSYLFRNKKSTSYTNFRTINKNFISTIDLINSNYLNSLYYICMDYLGNLFSIPDNLFNTQNDNYFIIAIFIANNGNIISYNTFNNNFNIVGNIAKNKDYSSMSLACIGDSLTHPSETGINKLDPMYPEVVKNILGIGEVTNCGLSGSTIANNSASPSTPMSNDTRMSTYPNADIIIVSGGYNDYGNNVPLGNLSTTDDTTFYGGYKKLMNYLITNNPSSTIIIMITPMPNSTPTSPKNTIGLTKLDYINAIESIARYFSVPLLDMNKLGSLGQFNKNTWTNDGLHFKQEYVNNIYAPRIANFIDTLF